MVESRLYVRGDRRGERNERTRDEWRGGGGGGGCWWLHTGEVEYSYRGQWLVQGLRVRISRLSRTRLGISSREQRSPFVERLEAVIRVRDSRETENREFSFSQPAGLIIAALFEKFCSNLSSKSVKYRSKYVYICMKRVDRSFPSPLDLFFR